MLEEEGTSKIASYFNVVSKSDMQADADPKEVFEQVEEHSDNDKFTVVLSSFFLHCQEYGLSFWSEQYALVSIVVACVAYSTSSLLTSLLNKALVSSYGFAFPVLLTFWQVRYNMEMF